jgi:hypothetical protein
MNLGTQIISLFILAIPIACIAWTVTHEEVFREPREYCARKSGSSRRLLSRKFFYLFTCEYCFSHYVTLLFLAMTRYTLLYPGWRGYVIGGLALVWVSNQYMSIYNRLRLTIRSENVEIDTKETVRNKLKKTVEGSESPSNLDRPSRLRSL